MLSIHRRFCCFFHVYSSMTQRRTKQPRLLSEFPVLTFPGLANSTKCLLIVLLGAGLKGNKGTNTNFQGSLFRDKLMWVVVVAVVRDHIIVVLAVVLALAVVVVFPPLWWFLWEGRAQV